jgi:hypothetical protein
MRRRSFLLGLGILAAAFLSVSGVLLVLVYREPDFYRASALPPGRERQKNSKDFQARCSHLYNGIAYEKEWVERFSEAQINSFFDEDFIGSGISKQMLPDCIREPRVSIMSDKVRLAFRYGFSSWCSTVVSIDFRVKLAGAEPNCVVLELQGLHAGSLPISTQSLLERISEVARQRDIELTWYRHSNGNAVGLLRFQANQQRPTVRLERVELNQGELVISGRSMDSAPSGARALLGDPIATPPVGH